MGSMESGMQVDTQPLVNLLQVNVRRMNDRAECLVFEMVVGTSSGSNLGFIANKLDINHIREGVRACTFSFFLSSVFLHTN